MASTTEAYTHSDPTQAEDGLFLNPSDTLILTGASNEDYEEDESESDVDEESESDIDEDELVAYGFAPGDFDQVDDLGAALQGKKSAGSQQLSKEPLLDDDEASGSDLEAAFNDYFALEAVQPDRDQSQQLELDLDAAFEDLFAAAEAVHSAEQAQPGENQGEGLEADLGTALDDLFAKEAAKTSEEEEPLHHDLYSIFSPGHDEEPLGNELEVLFYPGDDDEPLDDDLEALFSAGDREELFSPNTPTSEISKKVSSSQQEKPSLASLEKTISNPGPSWMSMLPSLPVAAGSNANLPSGQLPTTLVTQANDLQPPPSQIQPSLPPPEPTLPVTQDNTPLLPTHGKRSRAQPQVPLSDPSVEVDSEEMPLFGRSFDPDAVIGPPAKKQKQFALPPASELPALFQLDKLNFRDFEKRAKDFMLDRDHPNRLKDGGGSIYDRTGNGDKVSIGNINIYALEFLSEEVGERYYGVDSYGYAERAFKWPEQKKEIVELVIPLLRKICKNERQRQYAEGKRDKKRAAEEEAELAAKKALITYRENRRQRSQTLDHTLQSPSDEIPEQLICNQPLQTTEQPDNSRSSTQDSRHNSVPLSVPITLLHVNFVLHNAKHMLVRPKIVLPVGDCPSYMSIVNFTVRNMPNNYRCCSVSLHGPNGLVEIRDDAAWAGVIYQISMTDWMERDIRCVAGLEMDMTMVLRRKSPKKTPDVIIID